MNGFKNNFLKIFLIFLIFLIYYRSPFIFNNGRFVSLDLTYHLIATNLNFLDTITYIDYSARYINLISNISALISSRFFSLDNAPFVAVYLSLSIYLLIFYLILFKESYLFKKDYQKILGVLIILVSPVMNFEIWLNAINLQVYFGILALVILFIKDENKNRLFYFFLIIVAGLSGVYACLFMPLFFLKFINKKNNFNLVCFVGIFFCTLIQLFIIYKAGKILPAGISNTALAFIFSKYEAISYAYNVVIRAFFGSSLPNYLVSFFDINIYSVLSNENLKFVLFSFSLIIIAALIAFFIFFVINIKNLKDKIIYITLLFSFFTASLVIVLGGVSDSLHGRYASLTGVLLIFSFLHLSRTSNINLVKKISITLMILTITTGFFDFRYKKYIVYLDCIDCPNWSEEVKKYKLDNSYNMNAWPYHIDR